MIYVFNSLPRRLRQTVGLQRPTLSVPSTHQQLHKGTYKT